MTHLFSSTLFKHLLPFGQLDPRALQYKGWKCIGGVGCIFKNVDVVVHVPHRK